VIQRAALYRKCRANPRQILWLQMCYGRSMSMVASRELRNDTAGVLRRVQAGEEVTITVNGQPVAVMAAVRRRRRRWLTKAELVQRLQTSQADTGLREDLAELAGETTDDLDSLR
jgi:prevent-host-death family protein